MGRAFLARATLPLPALDSAEKGRVSGIDLFRGSLVLLVVLGHFAELTERNHFLTWFGYGFRMPLFIGLTGYLFNLEQARTLPPLALLGKYYDRLILPWLAACIVTIAATGTLHWYSPFYMIIRPPYHLWFVPVILAFFLAARLSSLRPGYMLAAAFPLSVAAMYLFGVGHNVAQIADWIPDRRFFTFPVYFALGIWVARRPFEPERTRFSFMIAAAGMVWWALLHKHPSVSGEAAAELLMCVPLITQFPLLRRITFDVPFISAVGRDSLFFYLWHPLSFALWAATGATGLLLLTLSVVSILSAWAAIARLHGLSGILGVRPASLPVRSITVRLPEVSTESTA
jgi:acyltransferase